MGGGTSILIMPNVCCKGGSLGGLQDPTDRVEILVLPMNSVALGPSLNLSMPHHPCVHSALRESLCEGSVGSGMCSSACPAHSEHSINVKLYY